MAKNNIVGEVVETLEGDVERFLKSVNTTIGEGDDWVASLPRAAAQGRALIRGIQSVIDRAEAIYAKVKPATEDKVGFQIGGKSAALNDHKARLLAEIDA